MSLTDMNALFLLVSVVAIIAFAVMVIREEAKNAYRVHHFVK